MTIGVFDSGIGGEAVARHLEVAFPEATIITVNDHEHVPYGSRTAEDIKRLTEAALQPLIKADCACIVIACNTATAASIDYLRITYPHQRFVGLEPMVKPAAEKTQSGVIAICATPATLTSERYRKLKQTYARDIAVIEPDCSDWASLIEASRENDIKIDDSCKACSLDTLTS